MSQACLRVGVMKGSLAFSQVLAMVDAFSLLSNIFKHKDLCWAFHFLLASRNCSFCHWWAICLHAGTADGCGGDKVERGGVQTVGGYMARLRHEKGCLCLCKVIG